MPLNTFVTHRRIVRHEAIPCHDAGYFSSILRWLCRVFAGKSQFLFLYLFVADDRYNLTNFLKEFYECYDRNRFARLC